MRKAVLWIPLTAAAVLAIWQPAARAGSIVILDETTPPSGMSGSTGTTTIAPVDSNTARARAGGQKARDYQSGKPVQDETILVLPGRTGMPPPSGDTTLDRARDSAGRARDHSQGNKNDSSTGSDTILVLPGRAVTTQSSSGDANIDRARDSSSRARDYIQGGMSASGSGDTVLILPSDSESQGGLQPGQRMDNEDRLKLNAMKARGYLQGKKTCATTGVVIGGIGENGGSEGVTAYSRDVVTTGQCR